MGTLSMAADAVQGTLCGDDGSFDAVSTDTRTLRPGELFFALRGERFDAARFVADAARIGAAGAVVDRQLAVRISQIEVADTRDALGTLARHWRETFTLPIIGVTGSNGKTTVKEMIAGILHADDASAEQDSLLVTSGNLNNEIGLPMTVLQLRDRHRVAVLEMGASRRGDIAYLADIAGPTIGVVTNAGAAHLEGFGSTEAVAATKGEMFAALRAGGVAVLNRDDAFFPLWRQLAGHVRIVTFGLHEESDFRATNVRELIDERACSLEFDLHTPDGDASIELPMAGRHNVINALAASAAARAAGASLDAVRVGLAEVRNVPGRLTVESGYGGLRLYDDSYNANPVSVGAAIAFLAAQSTQTWLVLGDMAELGPDSNSLHRAAGDCARQSGISRLFCYGAKAREAADAFGAGALAFDDLDALTDAIRAAAQPGVTVLVKGSRSMGLDRLVAVLRNPSREGSA